MLILQIPYLISVHELIESQCLVLNALQLLQKSSCEIAVLCSLFWMELYKAVCSGLSSNTQLCDRWLLRISHCLPWKQVLFECL